MDEGLVWQDILFWATSGLFGCLVAARLARRKERKAQRGDSAHE